MTNMTHAPLTGMMRRIAGYGIFLAVQALAVAYFVVDGAADVVQQMETGITVEVVMECLVAVALAGGVIVGARHLVKLTRERRARDASLQVARGALADHVLARFADWGLSRSEAEVAIFALKGLQIAEIANLRQSAQGTVRSQLSQVYGKAGVGSQSALIALFFDDLLDPLASATTPTSSRE